GGRWRRSVKGSGGVRPLTPVVRVGGEDEPVTGSDVIGEAGIAGRVLRVEGGDLRVAELVAEVPAGDVPHPVAPRYLVHQRRGRPAGGGGVGGRGRRGRPARRTRYRGGRGAGGGGGWPVGRRSRGRALRGRPRHHRRVRGGAGGADRGQPRQRRRHEHPGQPL